ncbi:hypothetical protein EYC58_03235 [Candidatus Saccharibacteria bacterium]|nr:MAG: hypothetical protein EYC58_03235 [Candidatus Saccharibacteria bacterium]
MQQIITKDLLVALGIELNEDQLEKLVEHANTTLHERVGAEITESLDDDKLKELITLQEAGNNEETSKWLTVNVPELKEIIEDERDILLGEIAENTDF